MTLRTFSKGSKNRRNPDYGRYSLPEEPFLLLPRYSKVRTSTDTSELSEIGSLPAEAYEE